MWTLGTACNQGTKTSKTDSKAARGKYIKGGWEKDMENMEDLSKVHQSKSLPKQPLPNEFPYETIGRVPLVQPRHGYHFSWEVKWHLSRLSFQSLTFTASSSMKGLVFYLDESVVAYPETCWAASIVFESVRPTTLVFTVIVLVAQIHLVYNCNHSKSMLPA